MSRRPTVELTCQVLAFPVCPAETTARDQGMQGNFSGSFVARFQMRTFHCENNFLLTSQDAERYVLFQLWPFSDRPRTRTSLQISHGLQSVMKPKYKKSYKGKLTIKTCHYFAEEHIRATLHSTLNITAAFRGEHLGSVMCSLNKQLQCFLVIPAPAEEQPCLPLKSAALTPEYKLNRLPVNENIRCPRDGNLQDNRGETGSSSLLRDTSWAG